MSEAARDISGTFRSPCASSTGSKRGATQKQLQVPTRSLLLPVAIASVSGRATASVARGVLSVRLAMSIV